MESIKEETRQLVSNAKRMAQEGKLEESMELFRRAYALCPTEKLKQRINKLQEFMENMSDSDDENMVDIGGNFFLHRNIANKLYPYQKEGVKWFWQLFNKKEGGILGDDMGLGKTIQVIAFMAGMFDEELIRHVIIVCPVSVLCTWEKEFKKWAGGIRLKMFHGPSKKERQKNLKKIQETSGILLTTYGMVVTSHQLFNEYNEKTFCWDYIILDEGHKIKNPNKTSKAIRDVRSHNHFILTGTPIQNNLSELWSLFDFTQQGQLLGTKKTFQTEFEKPIVRAREKNSSAYEQELGEKISKKLRYIIKPYFLRRTKAELFSKKKSINEEINDNEETVKPVVKQISVPNLTATKDDIVVWVYMSELQVKVYEGFVRSDRVKKTLMTTRSPLAELSVLKKIADHPRLQTTLSKLLTCGDKDEQESRLDCGLDNFSEETDDNIHVNEAVDAPPVETLIKESGKVEFLVYLVDQLKRDGHRTVIFSQSRKMLDIIQKVLLSCENKMIRIDGTIRNPSDRQKLINVFQTDNSYNIMLMTTQVGNVGLTLTSADRLVIVDPSWNPGTDAQAVDRVYRLGQKKDVIIYRLITCGGIEEKIYRKQIFKNAVMKQTTGSSHNPYRYFTNQELRELFVLDNPRDSKTQKQLEEMHPSKNDSVSFKKHVENIRNFSCVHGISHHTQLFTQEAVNDKTDLIEDEIDSQVELATQKLTQEMNCVTISSPKSRKRPKSSDKSNESTSYKYSEESDVHQVSNDQESGQGSFQSVDLVSAVNNLTIVDLDKSDVHDRENQSVVSTEPKINRSNEASDSISTSFHEDNSNDYQSHEENDQSNVIQLENINQSSVVAKENINQSTIDHEEVVNQSNIFHDEKINQSSVVHEKDINQSGSSVKCRNDSESSVPSQNDSASPEEANSSKRSGVDVSLGEETSPKAYKPFEFNNSCFDAEMDSSANISTDERKESRQDTYIFSGKSSLDMNSLNEVSYTSNQSASSDIDQSKVSYTSNQSNDEVFDQSMNNVPSESLTHSSVQNDENSDNESSESMKDFIVDDDDIESSYEQQHHSPNNVSEVDTRSKYEPASNNHLKSSVNINLSRDVSQEEVDKSIKFTPSRVTVLGHNYRTPPVSPVINSRCNAQMEPDERHSSTPLVDYHRSNRNENKKFDSKSNHAQTKISTENVSEEVKQETITDKNSQNLSINSNSSMMSNNFLEKDRASTSTISFTDETSGSYVETNDVSCSPISYQKSSTSFESNSKENQFVSSTSLKTISVCSEPRKSIVECYDAGCSPIVFDSPEASHEFPIVDEKVRNANKQENISSTPYQEIIGEKLDELTEVVGLEVPSSCTPCEKSAIATENTETQLVSKNVVTNKMEITSTEILAGDSEKYSNDTEPVVDATEKVVSIPGGSNYLDNDTQVIPSTLISEAPPVIELKRTFEMQGKYDVSISSEESEQFDFKSMVPSNDAENPFSCPFPGPFSQPDSGFNHTVIPDSIGTNRQSNSIERININNTWSSSDSRSNILLKKLLRDDHLPSEQPNKNFSVGNALEIGDSEKSFPDDMSTESIKDDEIQQAEVNASSSDDKEANSLRETIPDNESENECNNGKSLLLDDSETRSFTECSDMKLSEEDLLIKSDEISKESVECKDHDDADCCVSSDNDINKLEEIDVKYDQNFISNDDDDFAAKCNRLEKLMRENMGNKDIDDHALIEIVKLIKEVMYE